MAYIAAVSKRLVAASGAFLAAIAIAGPATAYADEPNNNQQQPQPAELVSAPVQQTPPGDQQLAPAQELAPGQHDMMQNAQEAQDEQQRQMAEQQADQMGQATTAGAGVSTASMAAMGPQIGMQLAMMAPMMAMYAPMMAMPLATPLMTSLATSGAAAGAVTGTDLAAGGAAVAGSSAATDFAGATAADLPFNLGEGLTPDLTAAVADVAGMPVDPTDFLDPSLLDPTMLTDSLGDAGSELAAQGAEAGANIGGDVALCVVGAVLLGGNC